MTKRTEHILDLKNVDSLGEDILFQRELNYSSKIRKEIYFDTSGVIDMLLGLDGLFQGQKIQWWSYKRPSALVYALAYRDWLGPINTLPPHTRELINKVHNNKILFKENYPKKEMLRLRTQFWAELNLNIKDFQEIKESGEDLTDWVDKLKLDSLDIFKRIYLDMEGGFWKKRYKTLVKDKNILNLFSDQSYDIREITKSELFNAVLQQLNKDRDKNSHNNYTDAVALTILDQKLQRFKEGKLTNQLNINALPIFFSDQDHILKTVKYLSEHPPIKSQKPFTFRGRTRDFIIVRNANFFILEGIMQAKKKENESYSIDEFIMNTYSSLPPRIQEELAQIVKSSYKSGSEDKFLLEFFDQWWEKDGYDELEKVIEEAILEQEREHLDAEVTTYIKEERVRIKNYFNAFSRRFLLIRQIWNEFEGLEHFIDSNFETKNKKLDLYKEFIPRFSYTENVCEKATEVCNRIFAAINNKNSNELLRAWSEVVSEIDHALFEPQNNEEERLDYLAKGLAILWIFERYDIVEQICSIIHELYVDRNSNSDDQYPTPTFAIIHAASIFLGSKKDEKRVHEIINCVKRKFGKKNYKVWIGLSYLYFLLWKENIESYEFPELHYQYNNKDQFVLHNQHLYFSKDYCMMAINWLREEKKKPNYSENLKERQLKYYYAINNYIFLATVISEPDEFKQMEMEEFANILEDISEDEVYWQGARFSDTLARFFYRLAFISVNQHEFNINIEEAARFNSMSMDLSMRIRPYYKKLHRKIKKWRARGYFSAKRFRENYKPFVPIPDPIIIQDSE